MYYSNRATSALITNFYPVNISAFRTNAYAINFGCRHSRLDRYYRSWDNTINNLVIDNAADFTGSKVIVNAAGNDPESDFC